MFCNRILCFLLTWLLMAVGGWTWPARAETDPLLTLEQAIQAAMENNPQLQAERAKLNVSEAAIVTAGARLNPVLFQDTGIAEGTSRLGLEQVFELGGKRRNRIAVAVAQRDAAMAAYDTRLLNVRADVRKAYTQLYNAQEKQRAYLNILQVTRELVDIAQKREMAGDIAKLDVLQTEIVNVNAQNDLQTAEQSVVISRNQLNALMKRPLKATVALAPPNLTPQWAIPPAEVPSPLPNGPVLQGGVNHLAVDVDSLIRLAYQRRPEFRQMDRTRLVLQRELTAAKANRIPNLMLSAGPDFVYKNFNVNNTANQTSFFVTGLLEIPLFNRQQGPIGEALARQAQLKEEAEALKVSVALEVTNAYDAYRMNGERIQRYEKTLLPYAVAVVDKSRLAFQAGKTSILLPMNAQQAYINTRLGYLQALMDHQNAISDLERAVGAG